MDSGPVRFWGHDHARAAGRPDSERGAGTREEAGVAAWRRCGGAFSILSGQGFILTVVPLAAIIFAAWYMERHLTDHWSLPLSLCLIIGGGIGNLIDRIFLGFVTDMIDFRFFPVFNIADIAVCVGAGFLILYTLFFSEDDASKKTKSGSREPA